MTTLVQNNSLLWADIAINIFVLILTMIIITVLLRWAKRMVDFLDLMDQVSEGEKDLRTRLEEWNNITGGRDIMPDD